MGAPDFILHHDQAQLVPSVGIANLLQQRDAMLERIASATALLREAQEIAEASGISDALKYRGFHWILGGPDRYHREVSLLEPKVMEPIRKRADAAAWDKLMRESGILTFMDAKAREEWRKKIDACDTPALTVENIETTFGSLYQSRGEMFERGVVRCFERLSWDYQTNNPMKFGKRIIKVIRSYGHFAHERVSELEDLQRVFCVLDGKPEEDHRNGLYHRLASYHTEYRGEHDDTYMHIRWFKNGNGHITFKRPDLVQTMNRIIARHYPNALPAPRD